MFELSHSQFLQALGWATLNSFWQMGILWCVYLGLNHLLKLSATHKYQASVSAVFFGFIWFITTFILYYQNNSSTYAIFENTITHSNSILNICLLAASVTYLLLLIFPAVRLLKNWQFVQIIKKEGLTKAELNYRLFVQKVSSHLGITKKVKLVVSNLVSSPVTVGYLKPMILLPVAAMNQLTTAQVEAILLHELSHIRRYDYLVNFIVSIIHTLLYFNPFVKYFMNTIENERETCCDELVLQFGYDKVGYAAALLHLEKTSAGYKALTLAAAGKQNLLTRIEKIVGMEKKKTFRLIQIVPLFAAMICILLFNSVLIINDAKNGATISYANDTVLLPWQLNNDNGSKKLAPFIKNELIPTVQKQEKFIASKSAIKVDVINITTTQAPVLTETAAEPLISNIIPVDFDNVDGSLTKEEKENVKSTVAATKKVVSALQWKEIESSLAEVMDKKEKEIAKQEYLQEIEKVNWKNVEQNLKANYDKLDWQVINANVNKAMEQVQLDSVETVYKQALVELEKAAKEIKTNTCKVNSTPIPDCSIQEINAAKQILRKNLDSLKSIRTKKVIKL
jgi:bla regulator protein blaR1